MYLLFTTFSVTVIPKDLQAKALVVELKYHIFAFFAKAKMWYFNSTTKATGAPFTNMINFNPSIYK